MTFKPNTCLPAPSEEDLDSFEEYFEVKLPPSYRRFLQTGNGGAPIENTFLEEGQGRLIERFLCMLADPGADEINGWYDISVVLTQVDEKIVDDEDAEGNNIIPIAALFGGDLVCLDFRTHPERPEVVVWSHEESEEFAPFVTKVAQSFDEFIQLLKP